MTFSTNDLLHINHSGHNNDGGIPGPAVYVRVGALADLMDDSDDNGQWNGGDVCDALADVIAAANGWNVCDHHGNYSADKPRCPWCVSRKFHYAVTVTTDTVEHANAVMHERMGPDEDLGFDYTVGFTVGPLTPARLERLTND